jgi:hypothetical protein
MGFLEVVVDVLNLSAKYDFTQPEYRIVSFIFLVAAILLAFNLKAPRKD